jgi:hypothetical protein
LGHSAVEDESHLEARFLLESENCGQSAEGMTGEGNAGNVQLASEGALCGDIQALELVEDRCKVGKSGNYS